MATHKMVWIPNGKEVVVQSRKSPMNRETQRERTRGERINRKAWRGAKNTKRTLGKSMGKKIAAIALCANRKMIKVQCIRIFKRLSRPSCCSYKKNRIFRYTSQNQFLQVETSLLSRL